MPIEWPSARTLATQVALGRKPADLVIRDGQWCNVHTREILPHTDIAIVSGRIAFIGQADHTIGPKTQLINAHGAFLLPGFIDGHMHVESTMLTVREFARHALARGTTAVVMDPHEMANVFGLEGVRWMHDEGDHLPLKVFTTIPSCVPSASTLEDSGGRITTKDVAEGLTWPRAIGLSEVMNFWGVVNEDALLLDEIAATGRTAGAITGHIPSNYSPLIQAYLAAGPNSDHECTTREESLLKARLGMTVMIRESTAWKDLKDCIRIVTEDGISPDYVMLVTDDIDADTLLTLGHMDHVVARAIQEGVDPIVAIQMATINPARYFHLERDFGSLAPGKVADILMVNDLEHPTPKLVVANGVPVAKDGIVLNPWQAFRYPYTATTSIAISSSIGPNDLVMPTTSQDDKIAAVVIGIREDSISTHTENRMLPVRDGNIDPDISQDVLRLAVIERHRANGTVGRGFVSGFGLQSGAVASTVAHDSHNLIVMGIDPEDMFAAAKALHKSQGGMVVVKNRKVLALVPLPIAGLMSDQSAHVVKWQVEELAKAWRTLGCPLHAPYMTLSMLALPVIPEIRLTNRGLVDVGTCSIASVVSPNPV